jgi:HNH endonuclease
MAVSRYIPKELQLRIREHFDYCCAYCLSPTTLVPVSYEFDHIKPISLGGETTFGNLCLACPSCNSYKGTYQTSPDPETMKVVALFHPQQDTWWEHFYWNEDKTIVLPLTAVARATIDRLNINRPVLVELRRLWVSLGMFPPKI